MLPAQRIAVGNFYEPLFRFLRPCPAREAHCHVDGFHVPRRYVDHQPLDLPFLHSLQIFADQINVPVLNVVRSRLYNRPRLFYKFREGPLCPFPADPFQQEAGVKLATVYVAFPVFVQGFPVPGRSGQTCQVYPW